MDQIICASLSRAHYWYEAGMLKAPAFYLVLILLKNQNAFNLQIIHPSSIRGNYEPVAQVVQLVTSKPSDIGMRVRISVQSHELGFFLTKKKYMENDYFVDTQKSTSRPTRERDGWVLLAMKIKASTVEGRGRNPVCPSCCVTAAGASTSLTSRIDGMTTTCQTFSLIFFSVQQTTSGTGHRLK